MSNVMPEHLEVRWLVSSPNARISFVKYGEVNLAGNP
jgi:hypothetical protein